MRLLIVAVFAVLFLLASTSTAQAWPWWDWGNWGGGGGGGGTSPKVTLNLQCSSNGATAKLNSTSSGGTSTQTTSLGQINVGDEVVCEVKKSTVDDEPEAPVVATEKFSGPSTEPVPPRTDTFTANSTGRGSITYTLEADGSTIQMKLKIWISS